MLKNILTNRKKHCSLYAYKCITDFLLFRVVEIQRICEATATPETEGANLSESTRTIRGFDEKLSPLSSGFFCVTVQSTVTQKALCAAKVCKAHFCTRNPTGFIFSTGKEGTEDGSIIIYFRIGDGRSSG